MITKTGEIKHIKTNTVDAKGMLLVFKPSNHKDWQNISSDDKDRQHKYSDKKMLKTYHLMKRTGDFKFI